MKTVLTFIFIIFIGAIAMAQDASKEVKVETVTNGVELNIKIEKSTTIKENTVARVYKFKNTRVKKELTFETKRNNAKIA
ncbi:hypothetical protein [uncultured Croceitalea sp.]|uniref:hypothetical protein n=1 Tax=uncultured Croceitalea sp. TaxID=1798908 RepID=UPI00374E8B77